MGEITHGWLSWVVIMQNIMQRVQFDYAKTALLFWCIAGLIEYLDVSYLALLHQVGQSAKHPSIRPAD